MMQQPAALPLGDDRNQEATVYIANVDERATEPLLWELFIQAGPVVNVHLPKDRVSQAHQGYGFVEFMSEEDADYAIKILNMVKLFGKPIRVNKATNEKDNQVVEVGATLFVGNLDPMVDEKLLFDTFGAFGVLTQTPKISRDVQGTKDGKGFAFIFYDNFASSDAAVEAMNGQFLMNRSIVVQYALKKDGKGERHGTESERLLAEKAVKLGAVQKQQKGFAELANASGLHNNGQAPTSYKTPIPKYT
ncbi:Splicing factor 3B subunit 4 [Boothiomyces sp. JEL0838]|nr:Splicing factor 3B subunit 4 [Boothiomyces sp. JEL0838]